MVQRLSYRRQNSYATRSNRVKVVKTPGGSLAYIYTNKKAGSVKCGDCGIALNGVRIRNRIIKIIFIIFIEFFLLNYEFIFYIIPFIPFIPFIYLLYNRSLPFVPPSTTE